MIMTSQEEKDDVGLLTFRNNGISQLKAVHNEMQKC